MKQRMRVGWPLMRSSKVSPLAVLAVMQREGQRALKGVEQEEEEVVVMRLLQPLTTLLMLQLSAS